MNAEALDRNALISLLSLRLGADPERLSRVIRSNEAFIRGDGHDEEPTVHSEMPEDGTRDGGNSEGEALLLSAEIDAVCAYIDEVNEELETFFHRVGAEAS